MSSDDRNPDETAPGRRRSSWTRIDDTLERSAGIDSMPFSDEREQQIIVRALAVGYSGFRWIAFAVGFILLASGLLFAALLIMITADVPRLITSSYARRRGVDLHRQSGLARNAAKPTELIASFVFIAVVAGLIAFNAVFGHPLIPWSWRFEFESFDVYVIIPFVGAAIGAFIGWRHRRRKYEQSVDQSDPQAGPVSRSRAPRTLDL